MKHFSLSGNQNDRGLPARRRVNLWWKYISIFLMNPTTALIYFMWFPWRIRKIFLADQTILSGSHSYICQFTYNLFIFQTFDNNETLFKSWSKYLSMCPGLKLIYLGLGIFIRKSTPMYSIISIIVYIGYQRSFCPLVGIGSPHPLPRKREWLPPRTQVGGTHSLVGEGVGGPNSDDETLELPLRSVESAQGRGFTYTFFL